MKHDINRRQFLGSSAKNAAGVAAGIVGLAGAVASASPAERVQLGVIGVRNQGRELAAGFASLPDVDVTAICDVDESVFSAASHAIDEQQGFAPRLERDFRRLLDDRHLQGVVIATPNHWHAHMALLACLAGKDVYLESPVSHNLREAERIFEAARKYQRVVQCGLQQRSGAHFQSAIEFVRSGKLGDVRMARAWTVHRRKAIGFKKDAPAPAGVNYDQWLGPAPARPFNPNRFHHNWNWFWDYGAGELGNWGVHMLDIARWGLGVDLPERITSSGGKLVFNDDQETPDTQLVTFNYPGRTIVWEHRLWSSHGIEGRSTAVAFYGENGTLIVDRGGWKVYDRKDSVTSDTSEQIGTHQRNFIDCLKSRELPAADISVGCISSNLCFLGNIAHRLGREIVFDPKQMQCPHDAQADALLGREYRAGWELPPV